MPGVTELHALWDSIMGEYSLHRPLKSTDRSQMSGFFNRVTALHPRSQFGDYTGEFDIKKWSTDIYSE